MQINSQNDYKITLNKLFKKLQDSPFPRLNFYANCNFAILASSVVTGFFPVGMGTW